ncbi:hypothetical protein NDU88_004460 [Pleurodeles waltl]|uniref:Uncharacterized protein n=1 Tax=Pleurodeles waltl TaxID=8319 RepID=A0AAV7MTL4_PLEWA|nr:hypothetical protein NDU88_004460 [Pleurodeles waltl]
MQLGSGPGISVLVAPGGPQFVIRKRGRLPSLGVVRGRLSDRARPQQHSALSPAGPEHMKAARAVWIPAPDPSAPPLSIKGSRAPESSAGSSPHRSHRQLVSMAAFGTRRPS